MNKFWVNLSKTYGKLTEIKYPHDQLTSMCHKSSGSL